MRMKSDTLKSVMFAVNPVFIAILVLAPSASLRGQGQIQDEVTVEGTLTLATCPFSFPVCVLEGDPGYGDYRILQDTACLEWLGRHVRVLGILSVGDCDPTNPGARSAILPATIEEISGPSICGDVNRDQEVNLSDVILIFDHLFSGSTAEPVPSLSDVNGDGGLDISDGIYLLDHLFKGGPEPICR
jgi:hypothetical protein